MVTRRQFMGQLSMAATLPRLLARVGPSDTVTLGFIGLGGQGLFNASQIQKSPGARIVALCDVDVGRLAAAKRKLGLNQEGYSDFRRILDRKDIDAVVISTPDHWHAIPTILACQAGKDVYVEKPLGHTVAEGRAMIQAARENKRIVQIGTQQRSGSIFQEAVELVRSGKMGKVSTAHCWNAWNSFRGGAGRWGRIGNPPDTDPPPGVDYDMWLGPAPKRPFNPNRFHWNYIYFWDYAGGMVTGWGVHLIDIVYWAMSVRGPKSVTTSGGKYVVDDARETPDTVEAIYDFPGFSLTYSVRHGNGRPLEGRKLDHGIQFFGSEGTLILDRQGYEVLPEKEDQPALKSPPGSTSGEGTHQIKFLESVRSRQAPPSDLEQGHYSTIACHLANISYRTGRKILWDAEREKIIGDAEAAALLTKDYRPPWHL